MTLRAFAFCIIVIGLSIYAWKDWYKSLCGLIVLTAVIGRPEIPESFGGIQGLSLWNILFANVFLAWLLNRKRQGLIWDMPRNINLLLVLWLGVILVGWVRMLFDRSLLTGYTVVDMISEELINTIKWLIAGLLLFDGCRTRHRIKLALVCILLLFTLFSVQIAKCVPPTVILEPGNLQVRREIDDDMGIAINGAAKILSGVPWAVLAVMPLLRKKKYKFFMLGVFILNLYALALTVGRSGYIACGAALVLLCFLRWRRYLILLPFMILILPIASPGARSRMLSGFGETNIAGEETIDTNAATTGRSVFWPLVIDKISESPVFGYGRRAMQRTGLTKLSGLELNDQGVGHPHQAYLQVLLDNGIIGFIIIIGLYIYLWIYSVRLFVDRTEPLYSTAGGVALALVTGHLVAGMGGQSFYPDRIDVGMWCAIGVMLRLYVARSHLLAEANGVSTAGMCTAEAMTVSQTPLVWTYS